MPCFLNRKLGHNLHILNVQLYLNYKYVPTKVIQYFYIVLVKDILQNRLNEKP